MTMTDSLSPPTPSTGPAQVIKDADMRVPVKIWAREVEGEAIDQAKNLARLPFALRHVALMPDAHKGYGMPIGGALFADKAVVPYAVGVDIGCGVMQIETTLRYDDLPADRTTAIRLLMERIAQYVPVGNGPDGNHKKPQGEDFDPGDEVSGHAAEVIQGAQHQLGTLGGGNHFIELQRSDNEYASVTVMIHSGSRSVGKKICDHYHKGALEMNQKWHSILPDKELAYLPWETHAALSYFRDMEAAMAWAEENRRRMAGKVIQAIGEVLKAEAWPELDVHHNYAAWENHYGVNGIVHRKGAVRARAGEQVLIPGSMGTASYEAEGLGNRESFETCQHGAGRARSRGATRRMTSVEEMDATLNNAGVVLVTPDRSGVIDESPVAYKDIEDVMAASADLVRPTARLLPLGVVKG